MRFITRKCVRFRLPLPSRVRGTVDVVVTVEDAFQLQIRLEDWSGSLKECMMVTNQEESNQVKILRAMYGKQAEL